MIIKTHIYAKISYLIRLYKYRYLLDRFENGVQIDKNDRCVNDYFENGLPFDQIIGIYWIFLIMMYQLTKRYLFT